MRRENEEKGRDDRKAFPASVTTGAIALVFLIIGFQTALFVHKAAVTSIVSNRDRPDTVYVMDRGLAEKIIRQDSIDTDRAPLPPPAVRWDRDCVVIRKNSDHSPSAERIYEASYVRKTESFRFNPNTVSEEDLVRLGFSPKQARSIANYRDKGGRFRRKQDFAKSYVVADSVYRRLEPFIDIPLVDLNTADSTALDALPGIGGYFASEIIGYRDRLGGYSYKEQLLDIRHFDREKFDGLSDLVRVDTSVVAAYPLWTLPEDSLRLHPYVGSYAAHGIVLFRENNPVSSWSLPSLVKAGVIRPEMADKLSRCRIEAPAS